MKEGRFFYLLFLHKVKQSLVFFALTITIVFEFYNKIFLFYKIMPKNRRMGLRTDYVCM